MLKHLNILALSFLLLPGCSPYIAKIKYEGAGVSHHYTLPLINEVVVSDERGRDSNWLGAVRGSFGNVQKELRTEKSTDIVVDEMYTDALIKSGLYTDSKNAPYKLKVIIIKFDCSYFFNREAHAYVNVSLIDNVTLSVKFSKIFKTIEDENGMFGKEFFRNIETLRNMAETAMNKTVEKTLSDPEFTKSLSSIHID